MVLLIRRFPLTIIVVFIAVQLVYLAFASCTALAEGDRYDSIAVPEKSEDQVQQTVDMEHEARVRIIAQAFHGANGAVSLERSTSYANYVVEAGHEFGVKPFLVAAIIIRESTVKWRAHSRYAHGLMQINWRAHRKNLRAAFGEIRTLEDLYQPRNNIRAGVWIFAWYLKSCNGDVSGALAKYLGRNGHRYINRVLSNYEKMDSQYRRYMSNLPQNLQPSGREASDSGISDS